ncbi:MAG: sortase, partial [Candidatus Faecousia sp.]|nr:sortase [Candidatus Faecousia sp.]
WETLEYAVVGTRIISPDDVDAIKIQPDKDMITLFTCHPYASGGRLRYLVFCERIKNEIRKDDSK